MGDTIKGNKNVIQTTSGTIASIGLEQTGKKVAGALVTPAIWVVNYGGMAASRALLISAFGLPVLHQHQPV